MAWFKRTPEEKALRAALALVQSQPQAQGGGGGSETRWRGASRVLRSMASWIPYLGSPSKDLSTVERKTLVARSRDAMRNHLIGRAAVMRLRTNVVGTGLICRPQVDFEALGISEDEGERINSMLEREWGLYAEDPRECDAEASSTHYQLQGIALISALTGGDVFVTTPDVERQGTIYSTRLQLVETDRVSNPNGSPDTDTLVEGVEFDTAGAPVFVHVCSGYPGEKKLSKTLTWQKLRVFGEATGRRRVLQVWCDKERPGQKRGAPYLAPVLEPLQKLERYSSAELMAAVISAMFTVFLKKGDGFNQGSLPLTAFGNEEQLNQPGGTPDLPPVQLGEGAVVDLAPGEEPMVANPARPNAQFDPFFTAVVKEIGAALEIPLDELMLHYNSSYSAARAAMLQAWRMYLTRRWWLVCDFCQPSYELLVDEAVARGRVRLPGYSDPARRRAYTRTVWIGPAKGAIDELKEANAAGRRIEIGVSTETIEAAAMTGENWHQIYRQRRREVLQRRADGMELDAAPVAATQPAEPKTPEEE
ncbi:MULTISPECIES: phage portal protein [unclassified Pseudomonas]|uniref:phage portal protein n=1 Tax=unclassified Pseudomonas TaxID=196821 RepID=UPI00235F50FF|nr:MULTISPECIES: phage portal protein [unclassified Pseudomonas]